MSNMFFIENSLPLTSELRGPNRLGFVGAGANTNGQAAFIPLHADQSGAVGKVGTYYGGSVMNFDSVINGTLFQKICLFGPFSALVHREKTTKQVGKNRNFTFVRCPTTA